MHVLACMSLGGHAAGLWFIGSCVVVHVFQCRATAITSLLYIDHFITPNVALDIATCIKLAVQKIHKLPQEDPCCVLVVQL